MEQPNARQQEVGLDDPPWHHDHMGRKRQGDEERTYQPVF